MPFVADFVGNTADPVSAVQLDISPESEYLTAYAMYENDSLARFALVDLREWSIANGTQRGAASFAIRVPDGCGNATMSTLTAEGGATALGFDADGRNIAWGGEQWSYKVDQGTGHSSAPSSVPAPLQNGVAIVNVADSEAVMLVRGGNLDGSSVVVLAIWHACP